MIMNDSCERSGSKSPAKTLNPCRIWAEPCKELLADFVKCQVLYKSANHHSIPSNKQRMTNINTGQAERSK